MQRVFVAAILALALITVARADWSGTKDKAAALIDSPVTWYCGCPYSPNGSGGKVDHRPCGYEAPNVYRNRMNRVEWEHVVPASRLAGHTKLWKRRGRDACERDAKCSRALFDLHNLVPSIGQVNAMRSNDRYQDLPGNASYFGACRIEDVRGAFQPPPCRQGDAARIWLYMAREYGVRLSKKEKETFARWIAADPVSPAEQSRDARIAAVTGGHNPLVRDAAPDPAGLCPWEQDDGRRPIARLRSPRLP